MSSDYRDEVLRDAPVAYWRLGERSGATAVDETDNGYDGAYVGEPVLGEPGVIIGDTDTAVDLTIDTSGVTSDNAKSVPGRGTIEAWVHTNTWDDTNGHGVFQNTIDWSSTGSQNEANSIALFKWSDTNQTFYYRVVAPDGTIQDITSPYDSWFEVDAWNHVVATWDESAMRLYVNGEEVSAISVVPPDAFPDAKIHLARGHNHYLKSRGLDEFVIYDHALSAERIQLHYEIALAPDKTADQPFVDLVVLDTDANPVNIISDYDEWTTNELYYGVSNFKLEIDDAAVGADELYKGRFLYERGGSLVFRIEQLDREEAYENGRYRSYVIATGPMVGHLDERITIPPSGSAYDKVSGLAGESAIMHYVRAHCAENAPSARQVPFFGTAVDEGRGASVNKRARYQPVAEVVREIGMVAGLGWRTVYRQRQSPPFIFEVIQGADKSGSVFIEPTMDAVDQQALLDTILGKKTYALVAGQGEGTNRTTEEVWNGTEPTGWNRRELFVDARDLDDTEATEGALTDRGNEKLEETQPGPSFTVEAAAFGEFRYGIDWSLGDILMIRNRNWNVEQPMRVISVSTTRSGASIEISVEFDRAWPSMKSKIREGFTTPGSRV